MIKIIIIIIIIIIKKKKHKILYGLRAEINFKPDLKMKVVSRGNLVGKACQ